MDRNYQGADMETAVTLRTLVRAARLDTVRSRVLASQLVSPSSIGTLGHRRGVLSGK